jgi:Fuc2NAc and GlcNAc transferase
MRLVLLAVAFLATAIGTKMFQAFAVRRGIVANPNFRSLHQRPMPRAGGIVFSLVFMALVTWLWIMTTADAKLMRALVLGGTAAALFGLADDAFNIDAGKKLLAQAALAAWILWCFGTRAVVDLPGTPPAVDLFVSWVALIWFMNLYNFMDGVDAMAASGAVFFSVAAILVLAVGSANPSLMLILGLLGASCVGFLLFNWPPATIFMGDAGSVFLGYCFGTLIVGTVTAGQISIWTWLIIFGYFAGDTTTTTVLRIFMTRSWYAEHRSHAYQNLANVWNSHVRVVAGVLKYHVFWLLPLALWSAVSPKAAPLAAVLAVAPVVVWTLRYGPRLSSA